MVNPLHKDETRYVNELWHLRDLDHAGPKKGKDTLKHLERRKELVHWLGRRRSHLARLARRPKAAGGGWNRHRRGSRYQIIHKAILFKKGGRVPHEAGNVGAQALHAGAPYVGKRESGYNDSGWLRSVEAFLVNHGHGLSWMIPGQPYCGMGVIYEYQAGPGIFLPDNFVGTWNIARANGMVVKDKHGRRYKLVRTAYENMKPGAIIVFDFGTGSAHHTGLARGPAKGGSAPTREWNTSSGQGGSQANGDGVFDRWRGVGMMLCAFNVVEVT